MQFRLGLLLLLGLISSPLGLYAQVTEDFSDGDLTKSPIWSGSLPQWQVAPLNGNLALQSNGLPQADTLTLTTPSIQAYGAWTFSFSHQSVNLSNANGTRVFLMANTDDLTEAVEGYYLQLGTNNTDQVRLYRQDGVPTSSNRVELGRSATALLAGDTNTIALTTLREPNGTWHVIASSDTLLTATDNTYTTSTHFGFWLKHSSSAAQNYFFDNILVESAAPVDTTPPKPIAAIYTRAAQSITVTFSEPLDPTFVVPDAFSLSTIGRPDTLTYTTSPPQSLTLLYLQSIPNGAYELTFNGLRDLAGNEMASNASLNLTINEDTTPPEVVDVIALDALTINVSFNEAVDLSTACETSNYELSNGIGSPQSIACPTGPSSGVALLLGTPLLPGSYTLTVRNVADLAGNVLTPSTATFPFGSLGDTPLVGDVIINEIAYDPAFANGEYIELFNRSDKTFNLTQFAISDNSRSPRSIMSEDALLQPGSYAVLVQDSAAFTTAFPSITFIEPAQWSTLNNGGDTVLLYFGESVVDSVAYSPSWGGTDSALERKNPDASSQLAANWATTSDPSGGTPGLQNSVFFVDNDPPFVSVARIAPSGDSLFIWFNESIDNTGISLGSFQLSLSDGTPSSAILQEVLFIDAMRLTLVFASPLPEGQYLLIARDIADAFGNRQAETSTSVRYVIPRVPGIQDLIINEIYFDPPDADQEFIEVYNRSEFAFTLDGLRLSDNRLVPVSISNDDTTTIAAGEYLVLARDSVVFAATFPGVPFLEVRNWPSLNDGGDTPVLFYQDTVLDSVSYQSNWGSADVSLERRDPFSASNTRFNWGPANDPPGSSPNAENTIFKRDTTPPELLRVIPNTTGDTLTVVFSEAIDPATASVASFRLIAPPHPVSLIFNGAKLILALETALPEGTYTLSVDLIADFAGNGFEGSILFTFSRPLAPTPRALIINEIGYDVPSGSFEFVELFNRSDSTYDLSLLSLSDNRRSPVRVTTERVSIPPASYTVLTSDSAEFASAFPNTSFRVVSGWPALNQSGDTVILLDGDTVIDSVAYRSSWGGQGGTLERLDPDGPSNSSANWGTSFLVNGTPGQENSLFFVDTTAPTTTFAEQVSASEVDVYFDEAIQTANLSPNQLLLGSIAATSFVVLDDGTRLRLSFVTISSTSLQLLEIRDLKGNTQNALSLSMARLPQPGELVINEVMFDPLADNFDDLPNQPEYVELLNLSDNTLSISRLALVEREDENGLADTLARAGDQVVLPPRGYALFFAQRTTPDNLSETGDLPLAFPNVDFTSVVLLPVPRASLSLSNSADLVRLHRRDNMLLESLAYTASWHDPQFISTDGLALERIVPNAPANLSTNWTSSRAAEGGTPGQPNTTQAPTQRIPEPGELVINEIMFDPRSDSFDDLPNQPEYFELYNTSNEPLELNGLFWTDQPNERGIADTTRIVFAPATLPPRAYALIANTPVHLSTDSLSLLLQLTFPGTAQQTNFLFFPIRAPSLNLSNSSDLIRLHSADGTILDEVTYANTWHNPNVRNAQGLALERMAPSSLSNEPTNWGSAVHPDGGTPGYANSVLFTEPVNASPGVTATPSPFSPDGDSIDDTTFIRYTLASNAALLRVRIFDSRGRHIRTLEQAILSARSGQLPWDGLDDAGRSLRIGIYVILIEAIDSAGGTTEAHKGTVVVAKPF